MTAFKLNQLFVAARITLIFTSIAIYLHTLIEAVRGNDFGLTKKQSRRKFNSISQCFMLVFGWQNIFSKHFDEGFSKSNNCVALFPAVKL